jgi:hypothetical protein
MLIGRPMQEWPRAELNARWFDIGFAGAPTQCDETDGTCLQMAEEYRWLDRVEADKTGRYRYLLDVRHVGRATLYPLELTLLSLVSRIAQVDGNGWSSRFRRLLSSGSYVPPSVAL